MNKHNKHKSVTSFTQYGHMVFLRVHLSSWLGYPLSDDNPPAPRKAGDMHYIHQGRQTRRLKSQQMILMEMVGVRLWLFVFIPWYFSIGQSEVGIVSLQK